MTTTDLPPSRRKAYLDDIESQLGRLRMQLALAKGKRSRKRILASIDELKRQHSMLEYSAMPGH